MGYAMSDERELFTSRSFFADFDIERVILGWPIFDLQKLAWLNGRWMRERIDEEELLARLKDWMMNDATWRRILPLVRPRADRLSDIVPASAHLFGDMPSYDADALRAKGLEDEAVARLLQIVVWELEKVRPWQADALRDCVRAIAEREGLKMKTMMPPLFVAVSGAPVSLPLFESMEILGSDMTRRRLMFALDKLAEAGRGLSKKQMKKLEKDYQARYA